MTDLFSSSRARELRDRGLLAVTSFPNDSIVKQARDVAYNLALMNGEVTINDVLKAFPKLYDIHPNARGGVFSGKLFRRIGYVQSDRVPSHGRTIGVWRIKQ